MNPTSNPQWRNEARCAESDPEAFFPEPGQSPDAAKKICANCPVRVECLTDALNQRDVAFGVRGGLTPTQRRELLRRSNRRAA